MKKLLAALLLALVLVAPAHAVNGLKYGNKQIEIIPDGSTDWNVATNFPNGIALISIAIQPSAVNDKLAMRDTNDSGGLMTPGIDVSGSGMIWYFDGSKRFPYLDASACTFNTPANVRIVLIYR